MKTTWKIGAVIGIIAIISMAVAGIAYAANGNPNPGGKSLCYLSWAAPNVKGSGIANSWGEIDAGKTTMTLYLDNVYPGYAGTVAFGLKNDWTTPGYVSSITWSNYDRSLFNFSLTGVGLNQIINSGAEATGILTVNVGELEKSTSVQHFSFSLAIVCEQWVVRGQELTISTASPVDGTIGAAYSQALTAQGGSTPYTWSIPVGSLPPGLNLNLSSGLISGTPTAAGIYSFTARVTDKNGEQANANLTIKLNSAPLTVTTSTLPDGKLNTTYSQALSASGGSGTGYTWSTVTGSPPLGLTLSPSGIISGKPTTKNIYSFTVRVTDSLGNTATRALSIRIK